ncbi:MAG: type III pantothenate kinase [Acidobacteria bacterium]|nr:type III pantothenate kinase [Acidobacteriota bacterium]
MLFVADAGNTQIALGVYEGSELRTHWRLATDRERTADEYGALCRQLFAASTVAVDSVHAAILSSVVPPLTPTLSDMIESVFGVRPIHVEPGIRTGMPILYENPQEVGADRIVNAVAGFARTHCATIVVDFGTATTFDVISARGEYVGGTIAPGPGISSEALFARAARLPRVEIRRPPQVIGRNTVHSLQSGLYFGYRSLVEGMVRRLRAEMDPGTKVIATGGLCEVVAGGLECVDIIDPLLTLEGLRMLHEKNSA